MSAAQKTAVRRAALRLVNGNVHYTPFSAMKQAILLLRAGVVRV